MSESLTTEQVAAKMGVPARRVRHWARLYPRHIRRVAGRYEYDPDILKDRLWWTTITQRSDPRTWGLGWEGPRLSPRQERSLRNKAAHRARQQARSRR